MERENAATQIYVLQDTPVGISAVENPKRCTPLWLLSTTALQAVNYVFKGGNWTPTGDPLVVSYSRRH